MHINKNPDVNLCDIHTPNYIIHMGDIKIDFEWYKYFSERDLKGMIYAFCYRGQIIKIGYSFNNFNTRQNTNYGDRLIRQINNLPGREMKHDSDKWIVQYGFVPASQNGKNIIEEIKEFEVENNVVVNREDIYLRIWDISYTKSSLYYFPNNDRGNKEKGRYFEGLMVDQYKNNNQGNLPVGNRKQDPSTWNLAYTLPKIDANAAKLFDFG